MAPLTREQRADRITELERWIDAQNAEFADEQFPAEVRELWNTYNEELDKHRQAMAELEERDRRLKAIAQQPSYTERGDGTLRTASGPTVISRMSESEVYDLNTLQRVSMIDPSRGAREFRDRAMRAVELAFFPHERADQDRCKAHVSRLLTQYDATDKPLAVQEIARRVLITGSPIYREAFNKLIRGVPRHPDEERALGLGTQGGASAIVYTLDPTIVPTSNLSVNPWRSIASVETIAGTNEWRGVTSAGVTATRRAEFAATTDASPTLANPSLVVSTVDVFIPYSIELDQDVGNLQASFARLIQDAKDDEEATAFATGNGTPPNPQGVLTGATTTVAAGATNAFVVADVYKVWEALGARFRPRATLAGNLAILDRVRQFDTAGGASLWIQNLQVGIQGPVPQSGDTGFRLLGPRAFESTAMASTVATGSKLLIVGDFSYYKIVDRIGMDIEVIPHLFGAAQGNLPTRQRGLIAFWRNYGKVLDANAFRVLQNP